MKLLKFYTESCCQCKMLDKKLKGFNIIPIELIDCEENTELVDKFQVRSLPSLVLIDDDGEFIRKFPSNCTREFIEETIKNDLGN